MRSRRRTTPQPQWELQLVQPLACASGYLSADALGNSSENAMGNAMGNASENVSSEDELGNVSALLLEGA
jgi:hypothetical protein